MGQLINYCFIAHVVSNRAVLSNQLIIISWYICMTIFFEKKFMPVILTEDSVIDLLYVISELPNKVPNVSRIFNRSRYLEEFLVHCIETFSFSR